MIRRFESELKVTKKNKDTPTDNSVVTQSANCGTICYKSLANCPVQSKMSSKLPKRPRTPTPFTKRHVNPIYPPRVTVPCPIPTDASKQQKKQQTATVRTIAVQRRERRVIACAEVPTRTPVAQKKVDVPTPQKQVPCPTPLVLSGAFLVLSGDFLVLSGAFLVLSGDFLVLFGAIWCYLVLSGACLVLAGAYLVLAVVLLVLYGAVWLYFRAIWCLFSAIWYFLSAIWCFLVLSGAF
jgi:hypothetical protein